MYTVAVIGHGRSPEGLHWGAVIDQCTVVRMWDYDWQDPIDYGQRYDFGVYELLPTITEAFIEQNRHTPTKGWLAYYRQPVKCQLPKGTHIITQVYRDIARRMGGRGSQPGWMPQGHGDEPLTGDALRRALNGAIQPRQGPQRLSGRANAGGPLPPSLNLTRGCAAACWAICQSHAERVILVGFDNLEKGRCLPTDEAFSPAYQRHYDALYPRWRRGWYSPGLTTCGTHDIAIELPLLRKLAEAYGVDLKFAHEVWP